MSWSREPGSFRDPSGFVFRHDGVIYRQVNRPFADAYDLFVRSGLCQELVEERLLVPHEEVDLRLPGAPAPHRVIRPQPVPFVSYPYEWCFGQLKAAALVTLEAQRRALARGLVLRDASAFNVQFVDGRPVLIDTLSFGPYEEGRPWGAYRQFCEHFLAPLALMAHVDPSCGRLMALHIDGVPVALASKLLPTTTRLRPGLLTHIHLHGRFSRTWATALPSNHPPAPRGRMSRTAMLGLAESLQRTVAAITYRPGASVWTGYHAGTSYTEAAHRHKQQLVQECVASVSSPSPPRLVWDLGANDGTFSRIAASTGAQVVSMDMDHAVVERHYRACVTRNEKHVLPLVQDLLNPTGGLGWNGDERQGLAERGPADIVLALALVHHLAIGGNVPFDVMTTFLARLGRHLIVEFVPKDDIQVNSMLATREGVFQSYTQGHFEETFGKRYHIRRVAPIAESPRLLYLMETR